MPPLLKSANNNTAKHKRTQRRTGVSEWVEKANARSVCLPACSCCLRVVAGCRCCGTSLKCFLERVGVVDSESGVRAARETSGVLVESHEQQLVRLALGQLHGHDGAGGREEEEEGGRRAHERQEKPSWRRGARARRRRGLQSKWGLQASKATPRPSARCPPSVERVPARALIVAVVALLCTRARFALVPVRCRGDARGRGRAWARGRWRAAGQVQRDKQSSKGQQQAPKQGEQAPIEQVRATPP